MVAPQSLLGQILPKLRELSPNKVLELGPYSSSKVAQNAAGRLRKQLKEQGLHEIISAKTSGDRIRVIACRAF